ncbi:MAG: hypothetical protein ACR2GL_06775 [Thermoleophilaceae bacterium]
MSSYRTGPRRGGGATCPTCGAPAKDNQLVCLECGSRVALDYRRPPGWRLPVAIVAVVLLLAAAGTALALKSIGDDAEREVARTPIKAGGGGTADVPASSDEKKAGGKKKRAARDEQDMRAQAKREQDKRAQDKRAQAKREQAKREDERAAREETAPEPAEPGPSPGSGSGGLVKRGALYTWPRDLKAFTVILLSAEDRGSAQRFAESAAKGAREEIGVIRAADFDSLPKGFFVVFAGEYDTRAAADRAAGRLGGRFSGAFPQLVAR